MSLELAALLVGAAATAVTFVHIVPQILRLLRTGRTEGLSPAWAAVAIVLNFGWLAYVVVEEYWVAIPSIVIAIVSFGLALHLMHRHGADVRGGVLMSAATALGCAVILAASDWTVLGTVLGLSNGLYLGPSVIAAWRSHTPVGVSPVTWILAEFEGLLWGFYGVLVGSGPIIVFGTTEAALAALVLLRLRVARHRIRAALDAAA